MKVFVVEDSSDVRDRLCSMILEVPGAQVLATADSEEAALKGIAETMPDLITLDLHLASGNGAEVLSQVKATQPKIKIIVLTAMEAPKYRQRCLAAGADYFLAKSRDIASLPGLLAEIAAMIDHDQTEKGAL